MRIIVSNNYISENSFQLKQRFMSSTTITQPIISTNIASASRWVGFDINGHPDLTSASQKDVEKIALLVDKHYALWNRLPFKDDQENNIRKGIGPGLFIALF